ncbi:MAG: cold shock domain-containing protein [Candidatus Gracilibacteria bacterium]|nr:cold shock domain-containing protein [Candidatus Gracilibacteria bacterium]
MAMDVGMGWESIEDGASQWGVIKSVKQRAGGRGGFGVITPADGGKDIRFYIPSCRGGIEGFKTISEGMNVSFALQQGVRGLIACDIVHDAFRRTNVLIPDVKTSVSQVVNEN